MLCFRSFHTAERTLEGIKALHMMRKGVRPLTMQEITPLGVVLGQWHQGYATSFDALQALKFEAGGQKFGFC